MIHTSYFAKYKGNNGVAITRFRPKWWKGEWLPLLAPSSELLNWWKTLSEEERHLPENIKEYSKILLEELKVLNPNAKEIAKKLQGKVLLCYENINKDFCHRVVVAQWFKSLGYECEELSYKEEK